MSVGLIADLSRYRPIVDMQKAVRNGLVAFITKATEGVGVIDSTFARDMTLAKQYNVLAGAFHFGRSNDPIKEADYFTKIVMPYYHSKLLLSLDFEQTMTVPQAEVFCRQIKKNFGVYPVIYTRKTYVEGIWGYKETELSAYPLWVASYQNSPNWPRQWKTWALHQYSNGVSGPLPHGIGGIRDDIDMDRFNPRFGDLASWWGTDISQPPTRVIADSFVAPVPASGLTNGLWKTAPTAERGIWYDANPYGTQYLVGSQQAYHTGADLNLAFDADAYMPVSAVGSGEIIFADRILGSTWGNLVVLECTLPDKSKAWFRYAHLDSMIVRAGDVVLSGQKIGEIGNAFGTLPYHLHFDVSLSGVLSQGFDGARDWPGLNKTRLTADYTSPFEWLKSHIGQLPMPTPDPTPVSMILIGEASLRSEPKYSSTLIKVLKPQSKAKIIPGSGVVDPAVNIEYVRSTSPAGWISKRLLATEDPAPTPPQTATKYVTATDGLRVRSGPRKSYSQVSVDGKLLFLSLGSTVLVELPGSLDGDNGLYAKISEGQWVSMEWLSDAKPVPVPPPVVVPPPTRRTKMSFHVMPGPGTPAFFDILRSARAAGNTIPGVLLMRMGWDGEPTVAGVKEASPNTEVVLRYYNQYWDTQKRVDWSAAGGTAWMNDYKQFIYSDPSNFRADYHQIINEPSESGPGVAPFWNSALDVADSIGVKLAIGCFAYGNPPLPNESGFWASMHGVLQRVIRDKHALLLHQYIKPDPGGSLTEDWLMMRHRRLIAQLPADVRNVPIIFGEFFTGFAATYDTNAFMNDWRILDEELNRDPSVRWAANWTLDGGGAWGSSLINRHLPAIKNYIINFR